MNEVGEYIHDKLSKACQNCAKEADRLLLEYMAKRNLTLADLQDNVVMQQEQDDPWDFKRSFWYKGELILCIKQRYDITQPLIARAEMVIEKGNW